MLLVVDVIDVNYSTTSGLFSSLLSSFFSTLSQRYATKVLTPGDASVYDQRNSTTLIWRTKPSWLLSWRIYQNLLELSLIYHFRDTYLYNVDLDICSVSQHS